MNTLVGGTADEPTGVTLLDRLRAYQAEGRTGVPAAELVGYLRDVAAELDALHALGTLHRNIAPDKIGVTDGRAVLLPATLPVDDGGIFAGRPVYMAPEVWGGARGPADEQYSLAATYVEARLGRPPHARADFVSLMRAHLEEEPDLDGLSDMERRAVARALAKVPADRFPTCTAFARAVEECVE